jgi:hypothetical protein
MSSKLCTYKSIVLVVDDVRTGGIPDFLSWTVSLNQLEVVAPRGAPSLMAHQPELPRTQLVAALVLSQGAKA